MTKIPADFRELLPRVAHGESDKRPIMYLWVYDPEEGKVYIETDHGKHPAHFPTHATMAANVHHPERQQGYAFSILGPTSKPDSWRIMDNDFKKLEDNFILKRVLEALRGEHPAPPLPHVRYHGDPAR